MLPQEFEPNHPDHVATVHVTEAEWFLPHLEEAGIPFKIAETQSDPTKGFVWALEGGFGQFINLDIYVENDHQDQFHRIFTKHFNPTSGIEKEV